MSFLNEDVFCRNGAVLLEYIYAKTILQKNKSDEWFGNDYNMNLYRGCCHGCIYCDSRSDCYSIQNFDNVKAKENAIEILENELRRKKHIGVIGTGAMSDPYNPFEKAERLTQKSLILINKYGFGLTTITKSSLIIRDIELYKQISSHSPVLCKMTITTSDDRLSKILEPHASLSSERFDTLAKLSESGIFTGIIMMPILPFIEDTVDNILSIIRTAGECGVKCIYPYFGVTLRSNQREYFYTKLDAAFPGMSDKYKRYYGNNYSCMSPNAKKLWSVFTAECDRFGILYDMKSIINAYKSDYFDTQMSLF